MTLLLGCVPDAPDARDLHFDDSPILGTSPIGVGDSFDYRASDTRRVQLFPSCVGHAVAGSSALCMAIAGYPIDFPSPAWIWSGSRLRGRPKFPLRIEGCSIRNAFLHASEWGLIAESRWPESDATATAVPPLDTWREGECAKLEAYYRIPDGAGKADRIRAALARGRCPVFGMFVDEAFEQLGSSIYRAPAGSSRGGHAMVIVGYSAVLDAFLVRNTWGSGWGDDGYGWLDASFVERSTFDVWVVEIAPEVA